MGAAETRPRAPDFAFLVKEIKASQRRLAALPANSPLFGRELEHLAALDLVLCSVPAPSPLWARWRLRQLARSFGQMDGITAWQAAALKAAISDWRPKEK